MDDIILNMDRESWQAQCPVGMSSYEWNAQWWKYRCVEKGAIFFASRVNKGWVKVTKNGYFLPMRESDSNLPMANLGGTSEALQRAHGVEVTGAGLESLNGFYIQKEARHRPNSFTKSKMQWDHVNYDFQWYEKADGAFIRYDRFIGHWCIFGKGGFSSMYQVPVDELLVDNPPADGWELGFLGSLCQTCRGKPDLPDNTVTEEACTTKATNHGFFNFGHVHTKTCPECHGDGGVDYAAPTLIMS